MSPISTFSLCSQVATERGEGRDWNEPSTLFCPEDSICQRGSDIGCFWHQHRTHLGSTIPIRKSEVYGDQKNITDLMLGHGPPPPIYTPAYRDCKNKTTLSWNILMRFLHFLRQIKPCVHLIIFFNKYFWPRFNFGIGVDDNYRGPLKFLKGVQI